MTQHRHGRLPAAAGGPDPAPSWGAQRLADRADRTHARGDPSFDRTPAGRRPKSPTPGVPEPFEGEPLDPADYDPRAAAVGTPIAFPDPDEPYPTGRHALSATDGARRSRRAPSPLVRSTTTARARTARKAASRDADVASHEANLGSRPSRQYDT